MTVLLVIGGLIAVGFAYWVLLLTWYPESIRAHEVHSLKTKDGWHLRLLRRMPASGEGEPVLLVHGAAGNHVYYESPEGRSLVETLSAAGYDCWSLELRGYRSSVPPEGRTRNDVSIDDFLLMDLPEAVEFIREQTGYGNVHYIGHSMGGMLMYAYELTFGRDHIASAVTLGSPPGFEGVEFGGVPGLQLLVNVARRFVEMKLRAGMPFFRALHIPYRGMPVNWHNVSPELDTGALFNGFEVPPPVVLETLDRWATSKQWHMRDDKLDVVAGLKTLETPLLVVVGGADPFTPLGPVKAFFEALPSKDKELLVLSTVNGHAADYSHIDLVVGTKSREDVFEPIVKWFEAHPIAERKRKSDKPLEPVAVEVVEEKVHEAEAAIEEGAVAKKRSAAKKPAAAAKRTTTVEKPLAKKPDAKKLAGAKKAAVVKKAVAKKAPAKKAPAKKAAAAKKAAVEKPVVKKPVAKKSAAAKKSVTR